MSLKDRYFLIGFLRCLGPAKKTNLVSSALKKERCRSIPDPVGQGDWEHTPRGTGQVLPRNCAGGAVAFMRTCTNKSRKGIPDSNSSKEALEYKQQ